MQCQSFKCSKPCIHKALQAFQEKCPLQKRTGADVSFTDIKMLFLKIRLAFISLAGKRPQTRVILKPSPGR
jgi:hypothetical protein